MYPDYLNSPLFTLPLRIRSIVWLGQKNGLILLDKRYLYMYIASITVHMCNYQTKIKIHFSVGS